MPYLAHATSSVTFDIQSICPARLRRWASFKFVKGISKQWESARHDTVNWKRKTKGEEEARAGVRRTYCILLGDAYLCLTKCVNESCQNHLQVLVFAFDKLRKEFPTSFCQPLWAVKTVLRSSFWASGSQKAYKVDPSALF